MENPIKSLVEFKDSVYYLYTEARRVKKKNYLRLITADERNSLMRRGLLVVLKDRTYMQSAFGAVTQYDQNTQIIVHDDNAEHSRVPYFVMDKTAFEQLQNCPPIVLYYYGGNRGFNILDRYKRVELIKLGDYISVDENGSLAKVYNFCKYYSYE